jgi:hypothetical protein
VPRPAGPFFIPVVHSPPGAVGHVAASELPSQEGRVPSRGTRGSTGAHLSKEVRFRAAGHVTAPELTSAESVRSGAVRHRGCAGAHLSREARSGATGYHGSTGAHLSREGRSGAVGHLAAPESTSTGRCSLKLHLTWQRVDAGHAPCLYLELVCGGTRSSGCRHTPVAHVISSRRPRRLHVHHQHQSRTPSAPVQ